MSWSSSALVARADWYKPHGVVMDATRISDGKQVFLKLWSPTHRDASELPILQYFSDPSRVDDPKNHCARLLDIVDIPNWEDYFRHIPVQPMLRSAQEPPFLMAAEALSWMLQALEVRLRTD
jgi:hypothetical protein